MICGNTKTRKKKQKYCRMDNNWKRKCWKSLSCRMRWKALLWTWVAKADVCRKKQKLSGTEREAPGEGVEEIKSPERKVVREETQDYVRSAEAFVSL